MCGPYIVYSLFAAGFFYTKTGKVYFKNPNYHSICNDLLSQLSYILILSSIAYKFDFYYLYVIIGAPLGISYLLSLTAINVSLYRNYDFMGKNLIGVRLLSGICITTCFLLAFVSEFVSFYIFFLIYGIFILLIWCFHSYNHNN